MRPEHGGDPQACADETRVREIAVARALRSRGGREARAFRWNVQCISKGMPEPWEGPTLQAPAANAPAAPSCVSCAKPPDDDDDDDEDKGEGEGEGEGEGTSAGEPSEDARVTVDGKPVPTYPGEGQDTFINDPKNVSDNDVLLLESARDDPTTNPIARERIDEFLEDVHSGDDRLWGPGESPALHPLPKDWTDPDGNIG
jgi:hypothetical protein